MKISYIQGHDTTSTETRITFNLISKFIEKGITILINDCDDTCDFILCMNGLSQNSRFKSISERYPNIKSIMYVWDLYPWTNYARGFVSVNNYIYILLFLLKSGRVGVDIEFLSGHRLSSSSEGIG